MKPALHQRMTNWNMVETRWNEMALQVKARWAKLSIEDIEKIGGKRSLLVAKLQESYGIFQLEAENQVTSWTTKLVKAAAAAAAPPIEAAGTVDTATKPVAAPAASPEETTTPAAPVAEKAEAAAPSIPAAPEPTGN